MGGWLQGGRSLTLPPSTHCVLSWLITAGQTTYSVSPCSASHLFLPPLCSRFAGAQVLQDPRWPAKFPFRADAFERYDESRDAIFYDQPRFVSILYSFLPLCHPVWSMSWGFACRAGLVRKVWRGLAGGLALLPSTLQAPYPA